MSSANGQPWPQAHLLVIFVVMAATYTAVQSIDFNSFHEASDAELEADRVLEVLANPKPADVQDPRSSLERLIGKGPAIPEPNLALITSEDAPVPSGSEPMEHEQSEAEQSPLVNQHAQALPRPIRAQASQRLRHLRRRVELSVKGAMRQAFPGARPWLAKLEEVRKRTGWPSVEALCKTVLPLSF